MKTRLVIAALLVTSVALQANPVMIDGQSLLAFGIVAFWALVIESGIATLALSFCGVVVLPVFGTLLIGNLGIFAFGFLPLTGRVPLWLLELLVIIVDAVVIKLVAGVPVFQRGDYAGVTWWRGLVASLLGNATSYFVGVIGSHTPWIVPKTGVLE